MGGIGARHVDDTVRGRLWIVTNAKGVNECGSDKLQQPPGDFLGTHYDGCRAFRGPESSLPNRLLSMASALR